MSGGVVAKGAGLAFPSLPESYVFWLFRVFSGCPIAPCAVMQFLWDPVSTIALSSLASDRGTIIS